MKLLSLTLLLPLTGAVLTGAAGNGRLAQKIALVFAGLELLATLAVLGRFQADREGFQLLEQQAWIPSLNSQLLLGVDGISVLFLPMTALLSLLSIIATWHRQAPNIPLHLALLLALEALTVGSYIALDLLLFYAFWQLALPAIYFLMGLWGATPTRRVAAGKYFLFMLAGGAPLLFAILLLAINHAAQGGAGLTGQLSFSLPELLDTPLPDALQGLVFLLLLLAFSMKAPLVPLHTWLPSAAMDGPVSLAALLLGLNLGGYGIIRFAISLAPSAAVEYNWALGIVGAVTLIYAGLIALQQSNLRRFLAYASISQTGLAVIGIAALNMQGIQGALCQLLNISLTGGNLMLIAGLLQQRLGSTEQCHLGGLAQVMPRLSLLYLLFALASIGIPLSSGFPAELLIVLGALVGHPSLGVIALAGTILGAAYTLGCYRRAFLGPIRHPSLMQASDLGPREWALLSLPALLVLLIGLWPNSLLELNRKSAETWLNRLLDQPGMEGEELALMKASRQVSAYP
jgi:NADH-quinone oxidoreductase subunit M